MSVHEKMSVEFKDSGDVVQSKISGTLDTVTFEGLAAADCLVSNVGTPVDATDFVNKLYVDNRSSAVTWVERVKFASVGNLTLSGTQTVDGIAGSASDRILVKDQTTGTENGIYTMEAGAWTRITGMDTGDPAANKTTIVDQGTINADTKWTCVNDSGSDVVGTDDLDFVLIGRSVSHNNIARFTGVGVATVADTLRTFPFTAETIGSSNANIPTHVTDTVSINEAGLYEVSAYVHADAIGAGQAYGCEIWLPNSSTRLAAWRTGTNADGAVDIDVTLFGAERLTTSDTIQVRIITELVSASFTAELVVRKIPE